MRGNQGESRHKGRVLRHPHPDPLPEGEGNLVSALCESPGIVVGIVIVSVPFRQSDLDAYLDEALPAEEMGRLEKALRDDAELMGRLQTIHGRRNAGVHSLGAIWRRRRLSCPSREQLGSYLLGAVPDDVAAYIAFHVEMVGCRYCQANLSDLQGREAESQEAVQNRRQRYFQSSAGYLRRAP